jgi:hypothetical protein
VKSIGKAFALLAVVSMVAFTSGCPPKNVAVNPPAAQAMMMAAAHHEGGRVGPDDIYPKLNLTMGFPNPDINQENIKNNICNPHWSTKSIRPPSSYTTALKVKQFVSYGYTDKNTKDYEEDHLISLELGGDPKDERNLWPEPYSASIPDGGARAKDKVENFLHAQVCSGAMTLEAAQKEIVQDWYKVYKDNNLASAKAVKHDVQ